MTRRQTSSALQNALAVFLALGLGLYFTFHAVQGDFGLFSRIQIEAEEEQLLSELKLLQADLAAIQNKTHRLSDGYLDLDLLDQQARDILGYARADEVIIR